MKAINLILQICGGGISSETIDIGFKKDHETIDITLDKINSVLGFSFDEKNIDEATKLSKTMMSYWAEFAYNGDPGKGRRGDLIRWDTWNNLEKENKFLIFDTPQDEGVRMNKEALSYEILVERL